MYKYCFVAYWLEYRKYKTNRDLDDVKKQDEVKEIETEEEN